MSSNSCWIPRTSRSSTPRSTEDLTRSILLQIILDEEAGGAPLFSSQMLAHMIRFYGHAMQGMMGAYMEKTLQTFVEVQNRMQEQSKSLYEGRGVPNAELWTQFMQGQAPMMQSMMSNYIEQSKNLFFQMQEQMQQQARNVFQNFPAVSRAGIPPPPAADEQKNDKPEPASRARLRRPVPTPVRQ